jgi:hypothetical protein
MQIQSTTLATLTLGAIALVAANRAAAESVSLVGNWRLNNPLTSKVQTAAQTHRSDGLGNVQPSITVGGIPIPTGSSQDEYGTASARDPKVLRCAELGIEEADADIVVRYHGEGSERLTPGNVQGTRTRWTGRKLTSSYQTTSRQVSKTFELREDGRMLVTVKLNPKQGATAVHKRVFDRVP